jgi:uncharacterized lipoprotein YmbA
MRQASTHGTPLTRLALCLATAGIAAGCSILAPRPDVTRFFTLRPIPEALEQGSAGTAGAETYGLGPIKLPPYLDRNEIATRISPTELSYSPVDRWAEPLQAGVTRVLVEDLGALLGTDRIVVFPWPAARAVDYQVAIEVLRFERQADGSCVLAARWDVRSARKGSVATMRESSFTQPAGATPSEAVAAQSALLGDLSREIATALKNAAS